MSDLFGFLKSSTDEEKAELFAKAEEELESGKIDIGLWSQALVNAKGDEQLRKVEYMKLRALQLKQRPKKVTTILKEYSLPQPGEPANVNKEEPAFADTLSEQIAITDRPEDSEIFCDHCYSITPADQDRCSSCGKKFIKNKSSLKQIGWIFLAGILMHIPAQIMTTTPFNAPILAKALFYLSGAFGMGMFAIVIGVILFLILRNRVNGPLKASLAVMIIVSIIGSYVAIWAHQKVAQTGIKNDGASSRSRISNQQMRVVVSSQDSEGATQKDLDLNFLKGLEAYTVERLSQKTKEIFASRGYPNAEVDIYSEATYVESGPMKLAVIRILNSDGTSAAFVHGIIGNELKRVGCVKISIERIPISYGACADKIKEIFGVKVGS